MRSAWYRRWLATASWWLALGALASGPACSLLYDLNPDQCSVDADCRKLGQAFPICDAGVCIADGLTTAGGAGAPSAGGAPPSSEAGEGGAAGVPSAAECATNADCIDENFGQPFVCQAGQCVSLLTKECPLVVGAQNLRAAEPIVFGAYALAPDAVSRSILTRNLDLTVSEFTSKVTGLRGGPGGTRRTLAFIVCNSSFPENPPGTIDAFTPSLEHLVDTLKVPGIVSGLQAKDLQAVFSQKLDAAGTFVISPYEQDSELAALSDSGRLWHLLGATADIAPTFGPLLKRTEAYLRRDETFLKLPAPGAKLRVAVVAANIASQTDVRDAVLDLPELADFEVKPFQVESAELTASPDVSMLVGNLFDYAPHIIVALAGSEFIEGVFPLLENGTTWATKTSQQQRPMYVLGSTMAPETWSRYAAKRSETQGGWKSLFNRIVGVTYASAPDTKLLGDYEDRLIAASGDLADPSVVLGSESVYDSAYLLIYAAAAAGEVPALRGKDVARGMQRLVSGTAYNVGPATISSILTAIDNGEDIGLRLTLGEPDWNVARGTRNGLGSVYCMNDAGSAFEMTFP
ncbi:MAG TPA: hypothetical protein VHP33_11215, partial [Polyangiaceae bacterium]|nr:hypothetical protein [Polyangiaceae bacterium]